MRRMLLDATLRVFARVGSHALSVELVLQESGLSRPTFYKHFASIAEALNAVLDAINLALFKNLTRALAQADTPYEKVEAALVAFRDWGERLGPAIGPLFAELHDPRSPISHYRKRTVKLLARHFVTASEAMGRPRPTPLLIETLIQGIEYLGYRYHLQTARDAESWNTTRDAMLRIAFGTLATEAEFAHALPLLGRPGISHAPKKRGSRVRRKKEE